MNDYFDSVPNEIFISFIFPIMTVPNLLNLSQTNHRMHILIKFFLQHCDGGRLIADEEFGLNDLYNLTQQYSQYNFLVIQEIQYRLESPKKRKLVELVWAEFQKFYPNSKLDNFNNVLFDNRDQDDDRDNDDQNDIIKIVYVGSSVRGIPIKNSQEFEQAINAGEIKFPGDHSDSKLITLEFMNQHPEINWSYDSMVFNPNITVDFFLSSYDFYEPRIIDHIQAIAVNPAISFHDYEKIWQKYKMACIDMNDIDNFNFNHRNKKEWYFNNPNQTSQNMQDFLDSYPNYQTSQNIRDFLNSNTDYKVSLVDSTIDEAILRNAFNKDPNYIYLAKKIMTKLMSPN